MDIHFIDKEKDELAQRIWKGVEHPADEAWIRFWSADIVQIDGELTLDELKSLVHIMESFKMPAERV